MRSLPTLLIALALPLALPLARPAAAQTPATGELSGRVTTGADRPLIGATVRLQQGATVRETRSGLDGRYRLTGLADGSWIFSVQAVGHRRSVGRVEFTGPTMTRDFVIERLPTQLDSVVIRSDWSGVRLAVGDAAALTPLRGAKVRVVVPNDTTHLTDAAGRTEIERPANADVTLTVEHPGFARRIVQAKVPARGALDLVVTLDSAGPRVNDEMQWQDMIQRLRWAGPRAAQVGRDELVATGMSSLRDAINRSPSVIRTTATLIRTACVFVDGVPRPGFPAEMIDVDQVEFVETYPPGSEGSNNLRLRWPSGGQCGAPIGGYEELRDKRDLIEFIVVWTRNRNTKP